MQGHLASTGVIREPIGGLQFSHSSVAVGAAVIDAHEVYEIRPHQQEKDSPLDQLPRCSVPLSPMHPRAQWFSVSISNTTSTFSVASMGQNPR